MSRHLVLRALLVVTCLQIALPVKAQAVQYNGACEEGEQCLWMDANYGNCVYDGNFESDFRKVHYVSCRDRTLNDSVSSYKNLTGDWFVLSADPNMGGAKYCIAPHATGNVQPGFNDKASSSGSAPTEDVQPGAIQKSCQYVDTD